MSLIHLPLRVDWPTFMATFPKPGAWTKRCKRQLRLDDGGFAQEVVPIYAAVRGALEPASVRGVDLLIAVIAVDGLPKKSPIDRSSRYVPHCKYRKADFANGDTDCPIPQASPEQVELILEAMNAADLKALTKAVTAEWPRLEPNLCRFVSAAEYSGHLKNWVRIVEEIHPHGGGLAIELV